MQKKNSGYQVVKIIAFNKKADRISLPKNWLLSILKDYFFSYILESAKQWVPCTLQGEEKKFVFHIIEQIYIRRTDLFEWCWSQIRKGGAGEEQGRSRDREPEHLTKHNAHGIDSHPRDPSLIPPTPAQTQLLFIVLLARGPLNGFHLNHREHPS